MTVSPGQPQAAQIFPRFAGQWVMVTGVGTGFGATIAGRAATEDANVVVHYNSSEAGARATAERVEQHGGQSLVVQADLKSWDAIKAMTAHVWSHVGQLDVLIINVGDIATNQMSWQEIDEAVLDRVLAVNIK